MKKLKLLLLWMCLISTAALGQINQIRIVSFQVKNTLPSKIDEWNSVPGTIILTAQKAPTVQLKEPKLVVQIRSNGAIICGNTAATAQPMSAFEVKTFTTNDITSFLGNCKELKEGTYQLCVQFYNLDRIAISQESCKEFKVESAKGEEYAPPTLITPDNEKRISKKDILKPIQFRWTPLVPKPQQAVTYRLKVWQLMQGQNGVAAMRTNQPIVTKDVDNITQAVINGSAIYTGPCKPPYLCDFVWQVQALNREGKPLGNNNGKSELWSFKILDDNINTKIDSVNVGCCINGKQSIYVKISNLHLTNQAQVTAIKYRVNGTGPLVTLTPTTPVLSFTINANSPQAFTGSINCVDSMKTIKFIVDAIWPTDPDNINTETAWDTLRCACVLCDEKNFTLNTPKPDITIQNNTINFNQPLTITTSPSKPIKSIKADLVYFEMTPENDMCIPCNKDAATYGHFTNGSNTQQWNKPTPNNVNINITTPQLTPCCSANFKWCIRYKIEFEDCTSCTKLICYEKKKEGCEKNGEHK